MSPHRVTPGALHTALCWNTGSKGSFHTTKPHKMPSPVSHEFLDHDGFLLRRNCICLFFPPRSSVLTAGQECAAQPVTLPHPAPFQQAGAINAQQLSPSSAIPCTSRAPYLQLERQFMLEGPEIVQLLSECHQRILLLTDILLQHLHGQLHLLPHADLRLQLLLHVLEHKEPSAPPGAEPGVTTLPFCTATTSESHVTRA